ncbi:hypothetical protein Tco_0009085 [Tanacetum coccineum]
MRIRDEELDASSRIEESIDFPREEITIPEGSESREERTSSGDPDRDWIYAAPRSAQGKHSSFRENHTNFSIWSLAFSRRLSLLRLERYGIDGFKLGIGALTGATAQNLVLEFELGQPEVGLHWSSLLVGSTVSFITSAIYVPLL